MKKRLILVLLAGPVLAFSLILWIFLAAIFFLPALWMSIFPHIRRREKGSRVQFRNPENLSGLHFNRLRDTSKLYGCNTRGISYHWNIFAETLKELSPLSKSLSAFDYGAGSLRDTWELASLGFDVTSVDIDVVRSREYFNVYAWENLATQPRLLSTQDFASNDANSQYGLGTAFDVIEHVLNLDAVLELLKQKLLPGGMLFITVPNKKSFMERYYKFRLDSARRRGLHVPEGDGHKQFFTPEEWRIQLTKAGFAIRRHDMAIGFIANNLFYGLVLLPLGEVVLPFIRLPLRKIGYTFERTTLANFFLHPWLMRPVQIVDEKLKPIFKNWFAWNLFVLETPKPNF